MSAARPMIRSGNLPACASRKRRRSSSVVSGPPPSSRSCRLGGRARRDWAEWMILLEGVAGLWIEGEAAPAEAAEVRRTCRAAAACPSPRRVDRPGPPDRLVGGSLKRRPLIGGRWGPEKARSVASALVKARAERPPLPACRRRSVANPSTGRTPPPSYPCRSSRRPGGVRLASAASSFP
jgi:hypothetical protein